MSCCNDHMIKGQVEALEFMAKQFRVYADDNDELNKRYRTKGKALEIANKRSQTWRDAAADCEHYAKEAAKKSER